MTAGTKKRRSASGFTLIELMIVVAIIGVLAALAIPNFIRYQLRSKTAEARTAFSGIRISQEAFRSEHDNYADITQTQPGVLPGALKTAWNAPAFLCPSTCDRTSTNTCTTFDCIGFAPSGQIYWQFRSPHRMAAGTTTAEFAIGGQADLDADAQEGNLAYRSANQMGMVVGMVHDGLSTCATAISASEVVDCDPNVY
ncbi:MAG: prepilin-type N-terminal cleavage/methylation domain-containing protein [Deltaproteobacteria bacterium]|nr:prepilin-type N-terminal cleavage/methylation domain-containing protein [Deltaproteobacteria bacterium]